MRVLFFLISFSFFYGNKFSYINSSQGVGKICLKHHPEVRDAVDGYTRIATVGQGKKVFQYAIKKVTKTRS